MNQYETTLDFALDRVGSLFSVDSFRRRYAEDVLFDSTEHDGASILDHLNKNYGGVKGYIESIAVDFSVNGTMNLTTREWTVTSIDFKFNVSGVIVKAILMEERFVTLEANWLNRSKTRTMFDEWSLFDEVIAEL